MAKRQGKSLDPRQLGHLKKLRHLLPLLAELRHCGCGRDKAHNRDLHFDQYVTLVLLYLFNPLIDSMRVLQESAAVDQLAEQNRGVKIAAREAIRVGSQSRWSARKISTISSTASSPLIECCEPKA